jgi:CNT family concentrative nucleoside transporter
VVATASPFVGQGESALLIKPFVEYLTISEIHSTMTSGFATIAGSVLMVFITFGVDGALLLTACVMSVPGSLLLSKMRVPETDESLTKGEIRIPESEDREVNFLHAATNGSATGVQISLLVIGAVLAVVSLYNAADGIVGTLFRLIDIYDTVNLPIDGIQPLVSIKLILSYVFL